MKQTYNVNIGGRSYNIDADAYSLLDRYLKDISSRLNDSDVESMEDIEARIADIFDERISSSMQVVNIEMVRRAMAVIGRPEMFGGQKRGFSHQQTSSYPHEPRRLYRSWSNKVIGGVCGGLGEYFDIDPNVIRLISVLLVFFGGLSLWVYIVMWIVLPQSPYYVK
jgi:phage shock protein PspC (stress-responsive transcriptional regulator)